MLSYYRALSAVIHREGLGRISWALCKHLAFFVQKLRVSLTKLNFLTVSKGLLQEQWHKVGIFKRSIELNEHSYILCARVVFLDDLLIQHYRRNFFVASLKLQVCTNTS
jgi:hypothetical protein